MVTPEDIFVAVRQLPVADRDAYLGENCESPEERSAVDALLKAAEVGDGYFAEIDSAVPAIAEKIGDTIGSYKLLQKIGEGGFGVVFMAEQREPIVRRVALKIIKQGMDTREVIARFEAERQALAMMDHPNIARVLDAGATDTGRPFFAMELVCGYPITEFCDAQEFDLRQRMELFLDVCAAVNHAHQKGIIHRDLKPSNILVGLDGDTPIVKVIDFGVAKALQQQLTDKTLFTRFEQFVGTPLYTSPEQVSLSPIDIDTRSDIYSLGVVLYELLAGKPPVDASELRSAGYDEMRRLIREKEAPKPSTRISTATEDERQTIGRARHTDPRKLGLLIKGDLDWIVLKALEKDRRRRYETANGFSADLRRFLADEPVSAVAPTAVYRLRKCVRRNRVALGVAAALLVGLFIAGWSIVSNAQARQDEAFERQRAEAAEQDARKMARFGTEFLTSIQEQAKRGGDVQGLHDLVDGVGKQFETDWGGYPELELEFKSAVGVTYTALAEWDKARATLKQTVSIARALGDQAKLVTALLNYCEAWPPDRVDLLEEAMRLSDQIHGPGHPETLTAKSRLGFELEDHGKLAEGRRLLDQALLEAESYALDPKDPAWLVVVGNRFGFAVSNDGLTPAEVFKEHLRVVETVERVHGRNHQMWARVRDRQAIWFLELEKEEPNAGHLESAFEASEESVRLTEQLLPAGHEYHTNRLWLLAYLYVRAGRLEEARPLWEQAVTYAKIRPWEDDFVTVRRGWLSDSLLEEGLGEEALEVAMILAKPGEIPPRAARIQASIALAEGKFKEAMQIMEPFAKSEGTSNDRKNYATLPLYVGERQTYENICAEMFDLRDESISVRSREHLVKLYSAAPWPPESQVPEEVLAIARQLALEDPDQPWSCLAVGMAEYRSGHFERALPFLGTAAKEPARQWCRALAFTYRAMAASKLGRHGDAEQDLRIAEELHVPVGNGASAHWSDRMLAELALGEAREMAGLTHQFP